MISSGLVIDFDLSYNAYVFEDTAEPTSVILDYHRSIIVLKVTTIYLYC